SEASAAYGTAFWSARAESTALAEDPGNAGGEWTDDALARDAGVRSAFNYLRATDRGLRRAWRWIRVGAVGRVGGRAGRRRWGPGRRRVWAASRRRCGSPPAWICPPSRASRAPASTCRS